MKFKFTLGISNLGLIHGDIKPENILFKYENDDVSIALTDFEFSGGRRGGTPLYISPEGMSTIKNNLKLKRPNLALKYLCLY